MHITLRPNEKIYINGAVLRVDRKVSIELMNDAVFLLEAHVMLEHNATTPLRKLYFTVQLMLIDPKERDTKMLVFEQQGLEVVAAYGEGVILAGLAATAELLRRGRAFEALKVIRSMLPIEDEVLGQLARAAAGGGESSGHLGREATALPRAPLAPRRPAPPLSRPSMRPAQGRIAPVA